MTEARKYRLTYQPSEGWDCTVWEKTAEEFLAPQGPDDTLLSWMFREADKRGLDFSLENLS